MKKEPRTSAFSRRARMRGTASTGPKRPCERATGSLTPRAIHSVSASTSKVKAHAARASPGQRGIGAGSAMAPESSAETAREPEFGGSDGTLGGHVTSGRSAARRHYPLPGAPAPREAPSGADHAPAARPVRGGRGRRPTRLHQRAGPRPLPHAVEPLRPLRSGVARPPGVSPPPPLRVLGACRLPRAHYHAAVVAARHARLPAPPHWMVGAAAESQGARARQGLRARQWAHGQRRLRGTAKREGRVVALGPRAARAALPLDDGSAHHPLAPALPEALRRAGARAAGRRGGRHAVVGRLPPLASRAFAPRHGRGDRSGPRRLYDLPSVWAGRPPRAALRHARAWRGDGDRGRGQQGALARADPGSPRPRPRAPRGGAFARDHAPVALRLLPLVPRSRRAPLRLHLSHRGVHARPPARARLLHAAHPAQRRADRPRRRQAPPGGAATRGPPRAFRTVVCRRPAATQRRRPPRSRRGDARARGFPERPRYLRGGG